ncbi:hypothetical protein J7I98_19370 [Streptomyces sp. ISL-98]|nr:hypothetical protein [Streptomyces sp. ISL-98]
MYAGSLPADIALVGDARATLGALREALAELHPRAAIGDGAAPVLTPLASERHCAAPGADGAGGTVTAGGSGTGGADGTVEGSDTARVSGTAGGSGTASADGTARGSSTATASGRGLTAAARTEKSADHDPSGRHPRRSGPDSALPAGGETRADGAAEAGDSGVTAATQAEESADHNPSGRHPARPGPDSALRASGTGRARGDDGLTAARRAEESAGRCAALAVRAVVPPLGARDAYTSGPAAWAVSALRRERDAETAVRDSRWVPYLRAIRGVLDEDAVITSDSAQCCYYGALPHLPVGPRGRYLHPTGFGTLGYALPAAIGAKSAYPERQVVALSGDGGLQFTVQELATAAQLGLPLPVVVFDNDGYGEIRDEMNARGDTPIAVDLARVDLPALCRAYGGRGAHAASPGALADALARALDTPGPTLITVPEETTA